MRTKVTRQVHLSHSQITEFLRCPRKYHLHYRLGLPPEFCPSALVFGSAIHEAIALYHQMRLEGKEPMLAQLTDAFQERWETEKQLVKFKAGEGADSLVSKGRRLLEFYLQNPHSAGEVLAVEERFRLALTKQLPPVWGVIDLVEQTPDGSLVVTDFKTAASRREQEPDQLILYREALQDLGYAAGSEEVRVRYVVLLKTKDPDVVVMEPEITGDQMEKLQALYTAAWEDIRRGCSFPKTGWWCEGCQWQARCDQR